MNLFVKQAAILFLALRAGDLLNLAAGVWLVPKYVATAELGAVLPVTTFATLLALPAFAFAMTVMRESAVLAQAGNRGALKSLIRGAFIGTALILLLSLAVSALLLPRFLSSMQVPDRLVGFLAIAAALLGCFTPVYTDALNALSRFGALATAEISAALARFCTLLVALPLRALPGYFLGNAMQPVIRAVAALLALRHDLAVPSAPYWTRPTSRKFTLAFLAITVYQAAPMFAAFVEQYVLRTGLPVTESAGYYMLTRFSDLLNYLTLPLLMVLFPHAAKADNTRNLVTRCMAITAAVGVLLAVTTALWGERLLQLLPNGEKYTALAFYMPTLVGLQVLGAAQVFYTNAEVAAGRLHFLTWLTPLSLVYAAALYLCRGHITTLGSLIALMAAERLTLFACTALALRSLHPAERKHGNPV